MTASAIVCAFNSRFARGFKVLVESLRASPRLHALDRIVITTDAAVPEDPGIRSLAARIRLVTEAELTAFQDVRRDRIRRRLLAGALPKYSMLKWFVFDDYGYDTCLYLDTDLINVTDADGILDLLDGADLVGGPMFDADLSGTRGTPAETTGANVREFCDGEGTWERRLNSGVLLFNRRFMGNGVREKLISLATEEPTRTDQAVLRRLLEGDTSIRHRLISPYFNFAARGLRMCQPRDWPHHLARIKFLHYVGPQNPWELPRRKIRWYHQLWFDIERRARERSASDKSAARGNPPDR